MAPQQLSRCAKSMLQFGICLRHGQGREVPTWYCLILLFNHHIVVMQQLLACYMYPQADLAAFWIAGSW
jgi:hypothetical protein